MKRFLYTSTTIAFLSILWILKGKGNMCVTFDDQYSNHDSSEACYYNPDYELTVPEIIRRYGYPLETYEVVTTDGYILTLFRIPYGKRNTGQPRKPVFLQHGTNANSISFVSFGNTSLAFMLAEAGYDVWLGNARGSKYSLNHLTLNHTTDSKFWDFSFHEYGVYDLQAKINFVYKTTSQKIIYIGYSLGTSSMYVYSATYPDIVKEQVKFFINLAPAAFVGELFSITRVVSWFWHLVEPILRMFTNGYIASPYVVPVEALKYICLPFEFQIEFCLLPNIIILGRSYTHYNPAKQLTSVLRNSDRTSLKLWTHHSQLWYKRTFEQYDYGEEENLQRYGTKNPPSYNLSKVSVPTYFIRANSDILISKEDVEKLYNALPEDIRPKEIHVVKEYGHLDLLIANNADSLVYAEIMKVLNDIP